MACSLFNICLSLFLEQKSDTGRFAALDEAHQFMTNGDECRSLTDGLLKTIRLQRHLGARVIISTQEPTISTDLLDLCSVTIVHRFTSPAWHQALVKHLAGASITADDEDGDKPVGKHAASEGGGCVQPRAFSSPKELFQAIVGLSTGQALIFAPSAIIGIKNAKREHMSKLPVRLGHGVLVLHIRGRVTQDGGKSIMAE